MSRLSKAEREEIIAKWLNNEEDENYEVKPLKQEGKYRVCRRKAPTAESLEKIEYSEVEYDENLPEDIPQASESHEEPVKPVPVKPAETKKKSKKTKSKSIKPDPLINELKTTNEQILNHLKLLGDDILARRSRKDQKREIKYQIEKKVKQQSDDDYDEPPQIVIQCPRYTRSRVHLQ